MGLMAALEDLRIVLGSTLPWQYDVLLVKFVKGW